MSNVAYIKAQGLPLDRTIHDDEVIDAISKYSLQPSDEKTDSFVNAANIELVHVQEDYLDFANYNILFSAQRTFKKAGISFDIWLQGDTFNKDGMIKDVTELMDGFRDRYKDRIEA